MKSPVKLTIVAVLVLISCERPSTNPPSPAVIASDTPIRSRVDSPPPLISKAQPVDSGPVPDSLVDGSDDESPPPVKDSTVFSCNPRSLRPGDTLTFRMETPHGGELSIHSPDDVFYTIVAAANDTSESRFAVVSSDAFRTMSTLKVGTDLRLPARVFGRDTIPEPVFNHPGEYTVIMGDHLASDYTGLLYTCTISFTPAK